MDWDPFRPGEVRLDHYRVPKADGDGAGCLWEWRVRQAALDRLGIELPEQRTF